MLDSAMKELIDKGYTDANDANALGSRATDGKIYGSFVAYSADNRFKHHTPRYYEHCTLTVISYVNMYMYGTKPFV